MTGRERLVVAAVGGDLDRTPVLSFIPMGGTDGIIVPACDYPRARAEANGSAVLVQVGNPYAQARTTFPNLADLLANDPVTGADALDHLRLEVLAEAQAALELGADGVAYILDGAYPGATTPMEYGGHYLEVDRAILTALAEAPLNLVFVRGDNDPYLDFVADLPAAFLGWDAGHVSPDLDFIRRMRAGALALDDPRAEVRLVGVPATATPGVHA